MVAGTGPDGRIIANDIKAFVPGQARVETVAQAPQAAPRVPASPAGEFVDLPLSNIRQVCHHVIRQFFFIPLKTFLDAEILLVLFDMY